MAVLKAFADVLQECHEKRRNGALYVSVAAASDHLIRFFLKDGEVCFLSYGTVKDRECLDILGCYDFGKAVFFDGIKAPGVTPGLPRTKEIIEALRKSGKKVEIG
jgi:hypothetical protein